MQEDLQRHIAQVVKARRKQLGLTQDILAERVGRTAESISNIERARSLPSLESAVALSEALDMPIVHLFPDNIGNRPQNPVRQRKEVEALELVRTLSDRALDIALEQIRALGKGTSG